MKPILLGGVTVILSLKLVSLVVQISNLLFLFFTQKNYLILAIGDIVIYAIFLVILSMMDYEKLSGTINLSRLIGLAVLIFVLNVIMSNFNSYYMSYINLDLNFLTPYYAYDKFFYVIFEFFLLILLSLKLYKSQENRG